MAAPGYAQSTQGEAVTQVEEIVVTGSRIARPNLEQPAPVSTITQEAITNSGTMNLGYILAEMPGMGRGNTVRANADSGGTLVGLNQANLRSLGATRTLTLVNGKRHVGGSAGSTAVDLNAVPTALVKGIEVVTGGASAIYGSDAVSDWPLLNALLNTASGATWVSLHHGGGVGMGYSQHSGVVIVADGTDEAAKRLERVLWNDPATGVMRHADAGYDIAKDAAREHGLNLPSLDL